MSAYRWKTRLLKTGRGSLVWGRWRARRGDDVGDYARLPELIREYAPARSFVDVGCMWGVNGEYAFVAEEAGAAHVKAVDVYAATPEFEQKHRESDSKVEFIHGDATHPDTIAQVGLVDVVFCAGVLYHHPSPYDVLAALRAICGRTLILRTATIPEVDGLPNAAVYFPMLPAGERSLWQRGIGMQRGITNGFEPEHGLGNWFWGLTPSCLRSLVETAGFRVDRQLPEPFAQTLICSPVETPLTLDLPALDAPAGGV